MQEDCTLLQQAISRVDQERSYLSEERRAYVAFREQVRLVTPDPPDATGPLETPEQLLAIYREEVVDALDLEAVYGDTLAESLEQELSPTSAEILLSKDPLTQRRKRNLLVETTEAIERREEFSAELADEQEALKTFSEKLADIDETLQKLPVCSVQEQPLEKLLVVWEVYDTLLELCEQLLEDRQQQIQAAERGIRLFERTHARNEFLYNELETLYPVLSTIAETCDRIKSKQNGQQSFERPYQSLLD